MHGEILVCERSAHPVLLFCLQDLDHDWRLLQLVNTSMCAAFRQHTLQVEEYTAKREQAKQLSAEWSALSNSLPYDTLCNSYGSMHSNKHLWDAMEKLTLDRHYTRVYEAMPFTHELPRKRANQATMLTDRPDDSWKERYAPNPWIDQVLLPRNSRKLLSLKLPKTAALRLMLTNEARPICFLDNTKHHVDSFDRGCRTFEAGPPGNSRVIEVD